MKATVTLTQSEEYAKFMRIMSNKFDIPNITLGKMYPIKWGKQFENGEDEMYLVDDAGNNVFEISSLCKISMYAL
ncbi:hypothetical protein [Paenibacillus sp. IHBB 3054]|uniref:hypothetical protein n=1 Tax=Paenibacillus sp. IHBB 3054 TaxID=3425689 RepID=UPI003F66F50D